MKPEEIIAKSLLSGEPANPQDVDFNFGFSGEDKMLRDMFNEKVPLYGSDGSYHAALSVFERDVIQKLSIEMRGLFVQNLRDEYAGLTGPGERAQQARARLETLIQKYSA